MSCLSLDVVSSGNKEANSMNLLNRNEVCHFFGGINPATLYRKIRQGVLPKPVKIGGSSRWLQSECQAVLQAMVDGRAS
jgi:predicted DNA-binding transcriptional regulator AlpA